MTTAFVPVDEPKQPDEPIFTRANVKVLWGYAKPHVWVLVAGILIGFVVTATSLATPLVTKMILDALETGTSIREPIVWLVGVLALGLIAGFVQAYMYGRLAITIVLTASRGLIQRFLLAPLQRVQTYAPGELVTRVVSDTQLLRASTTSTISSLVNGTISLVGTVALMAFLDPVLLGISLLAVAVVALSLVIILPKVGKAQRDAQVAIGNLGGRLESRMRAIRTVKASGAELRSIEQVTDAATAAAKAEHRGLWWSAIQMPIAGGSIQLALIVILAVGAWRVSEGHLSVSSLVAFLLYTLNLTDPVAELAGGFSELQSGLAAAHRIRETEALGSEDLSTSPEQSARLANAITHGQDVPVVALEGVSATYGEDGVNALNGVDLVIPQRGHIAIVGPSGAGKTTIFSLFLRFLEPSAGQLRLYGVPVDELSIAQVRAVMAYVEQGTPVVAGTVRDNLFFRMPDGSDEEAWQALEHVQLADTVRRLPDGLDAEVSNTNLSGGERQRLAVARALVRTPAVLLLDEATAQLDAITEAAIQRIITETAKRSAVVTIAHRLSTVLDADEIVVLEGGKVRAKGKHTQLFATDDLYREFVTALRIQHPDQPKA